MVVVVELEDLREAWGAVGVHLPLEAAALGHPLEQNQVVAAPSEDWHQEHWVGVLVVAAGVVLEVVEAKA